MADFNTIDDFDIEGKTVLVRVDVNAPVDPSSGTVQQRSKGRNSCTPKPSRKKGFHNTFPACRCSV